jgi:hypothetical protein
MEQWNNGMAGKTNSFSNIPSFQFSSVFLRVLCASAVKMFLENWRIK